MSRITKAQQAVDAAREALRAKQEVYIQMGRELALLVTRADKTPSDAFHFSAC